MSNKGDSLQKQQFVRQKKQSWYARSPMMSALDVLTGWVGTLAKRTLIRERPLIIAITGSVGKSSTKQMVAAMLHASSQSTVRVTAKNYNNQLGVPLTVFQRSSPGRSPLAWLELLWTGCLYALGIRQTGVQTFVFEMGADRPGDLAYLTSIAPPMISVVTAVTPESTDWAPVHAVNYPSIDAVATEKATLVRVLPPNGAMILNSDDERVMAMRQQNQAHVITFGMRSEADVQVVKAQIRVQEGPSGYLPIGLEVKLAILQQVHKLYLPGVFGRSTALALAASAAVGLALDLTAEEMVAACADEYMPLPGRVRLIPGIKNTMLLDDTYNASPVSVLSALRDLASIQIDKQRQRKIVCLGEMRELGEQSAMLHERIGEEVAHLGMDLFAVTGAQAEAYKRGALAAGYPTDRLFVFDDTPQLGIWLQERLHSGDLVLAKASEGPFRTTEGWLRTKGVRLERVIKEVMAEPARASELLCRQTKAWGVEV